MTEEIKDAQEGQEGQENENDLKFFEELQLDDFQEYESLFKVVCDYKAGKVEKQALKEKLFELRFRKLSDEDLDRILEETEFMKDGAISIFSCIIFLKKIRCWYQRKIPAYSKKRRYGTFPYCRYGKQIKKKKTIL